MIVSIETLTRWIEKWLSTVVILLCVGYGVWVFFGLAMDVWWHVLLLDAYLSGEPSHHPMPKFGD